MIPHDKLRGRHPWPLALALVLAALAWYLYQRNHGLYPTVFADEWYYSKLARLMPLSEAILPSYLYLWMFGASTACGAGFLDCVRAGNLVFFLAAAPFVYLVTRRFTGSAVACAVTLFSVLAPMNIYTAYFMPESTYYFGFWVLSWAALAGASRHPLAQALVTGSIVGVMSLVKVHALFLVPALCLFLLYASWQQGGAWFLRGAAAAALAGICTVALKFGLGWLLAGEAGLSLLGPFYQGAVNAGGASSRLALLAPAFVNGRGHLAVLAILYGVPLAILVYELCTRTLRPAPANRGDARDLLHMYTLLMLGAAAGMTIMYTATLAQPGSPEGLRLHLRYYSFVLPLLTIVAAAALSIGRHGGDGDGGKERPVLRWTIALALLGMLVFALTRLPGYALNMVDGPDVAAVDPNGLPGQLIIGLQAVLVLAWAARMRAAVPVYLFAAVPLILLVSNNSVRTFLSWYVPPGQGDLAGQEVLKRVPAADRGKVVVAGTDMTQIMRVQFHIDDKDSMGLLLESSGPIGEYQIPADKKWMVVLGEASLPDIARPVASTPQYTLARLPDPEPALVNLHLSRAPDPAFVSRLEGLSHAESWGRWSDSKRVVIHFAQPLPRRTGLILKARAYEVNTTLPFTVRVGGDSKQFRLGWTEQHIGLHFDTDGSARTLEIDVPQPISPEELGRPGDPRKLGIGISEITITDGTRPAQAAR